MPTPVTSTFRGVQRLPFTVAPVATPEQLRQVLALRFSAYGRHDYKEELKQTLMTPDETDLQGDSTTLVAVCKQSRRVLGTVRIMASIDGQADFPPDMPDDECLQGVYAYVDRLAVASSEHQTLVTKALMKSTWLWASARDVHWLIALALAPLARVYRRRGGLAVRADGKPIQMAGYHTAPYFLVGATLTEARARLAEENPTFMSEFADQIHPDICVHGIGLSWNAARSDESGGPPVSRHLELVSSGS